MDHRSLRVVAVDSRVLTTQLIRIDIVEQGVIVYEELDIKTPNA